MNLLKKENLVLKRKQKSYDFVFISHAWTSKSRPLLSTFLVTFMEIWIESWRSLYSLSIMKTFLVPGSDVKLTSPLEHDVYISSWRTGFGTKLHVAACAQKLLGVSYNSGYDSMLLLDTAWYRRRCYLHEMYSQSWETKEKGSESEHQH